MYIIYVDVYVRIKLQSIQKALGLVRLFVNDTIKQEFDRHSGIQTSWNGICWSASLSTLSNVMTSKRPNN